MAIKLKTQILQFSFIGLANAGIDIGTLNLLLLLWPTEKTSLLLVFNTIAYILAILNSYFWNSKYTFKQNANLNTKEIGLFSLQAAVALAVNNIVFIGMSKMLIHLPWLSSVLLINNISKGAAMFLSFSTSFLLMKYIVFRKEKNKQLS
ncbi:GtrA family protein [Sediminibacillus albus]|uniref:Putative flippase GtrA (Transmembrane translocase of bactoprenol-linked glucose) n=1 Tax=Sediminibacillus albus TaxID=407036 RepID=A0A1G8YVJ1_9BACI|nr:GtrA family protein [Sediminibacillus albus]SDK06776.1 Putative flippase GtrA (transmembrane translocase of bactoprenol-linked glucose) [Sediminibacillus albus]